VPGKTPGKPVAISDIAERAGVSVTTVSHVLSGRRPVAEATRARVQRIVAELGWEPNQLARSLRMRRSHTMALIVPDITNPFYPALARGLLDVVSEPGYQVLIGNTDANPASERALVGQMVTRRVDAIAFAGYYSKAGDVEAAVAAGIPVVLLGGPEPGPGIDVLSSDDLAAGEIATRYLISRGYRRIGFITGASGDGPPADRAKGYRRALSEAGIRFSKQLIVRGEFSRRGGDLGMRALLDLATPPRAVLCTNDMVAIGALDAARDRGLRVPEDVAVMGFDDIEAAALISPALTTVSGDPREQGRAVGRLLLGRLEDDTSLPPQRILFEPSVVARESA
jgi:LacI family transcriptional regulator